MSRYTQESPMDFEFQNGTGPLDGRSPFAQVSSNAQRFPMGTSSPTKRSEPAFASRRLNAKLTAPAEGPPAAFDSPSKSRMGSPSKPLPATPAARNNLFNTPRKPRPEVDDSSAGETPTKTPEPRDDSEMTPEIMNARSALTKFDNASAPAITAEKGSPAKGSPTKERPDPAARRESLLGKLVLKAKNRIYSPGRGELPRADHSGAIEKKRSTRRKREVDRRMARRRRHSMSDSGDDPDHLPKSPRKRSGQHRAGEKEPHWISNLFTFIGQHPSVPHILSYYAQFVFNVFLLGCCGYLIYCFWSAVQGDVDNRANELIAGVIAGMAQCRKEYEENSCDSKRTQFMATYCDQWERCMKQDPTKVARAKVSATTFAEIFNSFVEPISWKAMAFTSVLVFGCFAISNFAFGFFRHKAEQYQPSYNYNYPPPTPQRTFSGQDGAVYATGTPWHIPPPGAGLEPMPSGTFGQIDGKGSPVRRLAYN